MLSKEKHNTSGKCPPVCDGHFVEETVFCRGSDTQMTTIVALRGFTKDVRRGVPEDAFPWM